MRRDTTRPLIERIARELADKWDRSAKGPAVEPPPPDGDEPEADQTPQPDGSEMTTIDEMLRAAGKRGSRVRVRARLRA